VFGAEYAGAPLLVTVGNHERDFRTEEPILTGDLVGTVEPHVKWADEVLDVQALPRMVRRAARVALTPPTGPVFLALPLDVMREEVDADPPALGQIPTAGRGDPAQVERAAEIVAGADDPVLVLGDGVARAGAVDEAVALAEASGARVHAEILAREANFPQDHPQWVSHVPPDEDLASLLLETPTLVLVGTSTNTTLLRHEESLIPEDATVVSISQEPWEVGKNHGADAAVIGDPKLVLDDIAGMVRERVAEDERTARLEKVESIAAALSDTVRSMGEADAADAPYPSKAEVVDALHAVAPDALVVDEGVTATYALLTRWPFRAEGLLGSKSGGLGYGVPACLGAALGERQRAGETSGDRRTVVGHFGDGSYLYYPHAVHAAVRLDLDVTLVVQNNRRYRVLEENAATLFGGDPDEQGLPGMELSPYVDLVANAESFGASAYRVKRPDALAGTFRDAIAETGPTLIDVVVHD
jgi:benzoylformate decarboxylase